MNGLTDWRTTIPGLIILIGVTAAMFKGLCTFDRWWEIVVIVLAAISGGGLLLANSKKG